MSRRSCRPSPVSYAGVGSVLALLLSGCASTVGPGWVGEAHYQPASSSEASQAQSTLIPATVESEPRGDVRPRLDHTVTLGEIDVAPAERGADAAPGAAWGNPMVTINNYNVMNAATPGYGYVSFGSARTSPSFSPGNLPRSSSATRAR